VEWGSASRVTASQWFLGCTSQENVGFDSAFFKARQIKNPNFPCAFDKQWLSLLKV